MNKILPVLIFYVLTFPNLSYSQIIEIGKCYYIDGYESQKTWNVKDYQNSNTIHYKFIKEPKRIKIRKHTEWEIIDSQALLFEDDEIKHYKDLGYNQISKFEKNILSINLNNGIVTHLAVWSDDLIDFYYKKIKILKKLKKSFPNKWTFGNVGDQDNLDWMIERTLNKTTITKYKIETYVDGLIIARDLRDLQYTDGAAIKIDLNTMKYRWGFIHTIMNSYYNFQCTENYKNTVIKKNKGNKKSNSGIRNLLKKLY